MGIRSVAGGIGLASESIKAHKEGKEAKADESAGGSTTHMDSKRQDVPESDVDDFEGPPPSYSASSDSNDGLGQYPVEKAGHGQLSDQKLDKAHGDLGGEVEDNLEEEWNLDDAQDEIIAESPHKETIPDGNDLEGAFLRNHPPPKYIKHVPTRNLSLPVVLPQRRPKDRSRGFIRAYAPMLENCGIDQAAWLAFLDTFQRSSAANPWLNVINLASIGTMFMPHVAGLVVGYAIRQATNMAIELQARER